MTYLAEEVDALDSHAQGVDTSRAHSLEIEVCERSVKHPEKGEATSVEGGHDIQVTMSAGVQPAKGVDHAAPHVIVCGILVFHPMTPSGDKLRVTSG